MRMLILVLALTFPSLGAHAASIGDFDGKWGVDLAATSEKNPGMKPDEDLRRLTLAIDAKAGTMRMESPGRPGALRSFVVTRESPAGVEIKRDDGRLLELQSHDKDRLAVGELKNRRLTGVMYFVRPRGHSLRPNASDKTLPPRSRPSFAPPAKKNP